MTRKRHSSRVAVETVKHQLRRWWSRESSSQWSPDNPARGQCNVTALVLHDHFGGEILKTPVGAHWPFYNRINGQAYDLTADQFSTSPGYQDLLSDREEALAGTGVERYESLARRFTELIGYR